jgi:LysR family transcriptional regulator, low CO2-responsive transcriptional regulator
MNYTLHQLRVFQKIVDCRSITKAAESLNMTQPAVSIQLRNLQEQFDIPITELLGRQLQITDFGMELYQIVSKILEDVDFIDYKTKQYKGLLAGKLKIASVSTGKYVLPFYLKGFIDANEGVNVDIDVTNRRVVILSLEKNEVDFALINVLPEHIELKEELLMSNRLYLVGDRNGNFDLDLNTLPLIHREEGSGTRLIMQRFFDLNKYNPKYRFQLRSNEAVKQAVIAGLGYSLLPLVSIKNELENEQIKIIKKEGFPIDSHWNLVYLKNKRLSPVAKAFLKYIQDNKVNIVDKFFSWMKKY